MKPRKFKVGDYYFFDENHSCKTIIQIERISESTCDALPILGYYLNSNIFANSRIGKKVEPWEVIKYKLLGSL